MAPGEGCWGGLQKVNGFCRRLTCFKFKMKFISAGVKSSRQSDPQLETLSSANDEVITLVEICVVLCAVLPRLAFHQVYWSHLEEKLCKNRNMRAKSVMFGIYFTKMPAPPPRCSLPSSSLSLLSGDLPSFASSSSSSSTVTTVSVMSPSFGFG